MVIMVVPTSSPSSLLSRIEFTNDTATTLVRSQLNYNIDELA